LRNVYWRTPVAQLVQWGIQRDPIKPRDIDEMLVLCKKFEHLRPGAILGVVCQGMSYFYFICMQDIGSQNAIPINHHVETLYH
jgi:hypothetical protein